MNWKNTVKKIAAIAGSATMLGATMFGAIAAADLSTLTDKTGASEFYTTNGELNAFVGVGSSAAISDVAGAIDLAAAFAQKATLGGEGGGALVAKNVTPGYLATSGGVAESVTLADSAAAATFSATNTGFEWLINDTVVYNDTSYFIEETITTSGLNSLTDQAAFYWWSEGGIRYNISANTTLPLNFDLFPVAGSTYEIVAFDNVAGTLELGQLQPVTGVNIGESVAIGTTGITAKLDDVRQTYSAWKAVFTIYNTAGNVAETNIQKAPDETYENSTLGITLKVDNLYRDANDVWNVDFQWTEASMKIAHANTTTTIFPGYKSRIGFDGANGIQWVSFETPGGAFSQFPSSTFGAGESYDVFGGFFKVLYEGLRIGGDTTVEAGSDTSIQIQDAMLGTYSSITPELIFYNNDSTQVSVDIFEYKNVPAEASGFSKILQPTSDKAYAFKWYNEAAGDNWIEIYDVTSGQTLLANETVTDVDGSVEYDFTNTTTAGTFNVNINATGATPAAATFNFTLTSFTSNGTYFHTNLTYASGAAGAGVLTLTEGDGQTIHYTYNQTTQEVVVGSTSNVAEGGSSRYSKWGTLVSYVSNVMEWKVPEMQKVGKVAVGRTAEQTATVAIGGEIGTTGWVLRSGGGESPVWTFAGPTDQGVSKLDTEYTNNAPIVLVGGPAANSLVASLVADGKAFVGANDTALVPAANHAYVELVEDAFGTYDALIIAGYGSADTRMACKVVASQILHGTPLGTSFDGTRVYLKTSGTGVSTIGDVTVETA